jgi:hypothetical protein
MAFLAITDSMSTCKWEKIVIYASPGPGKWGHVVTFRTGGRISAGNVIGIRGGLIIFSMAINAFDAERTKNEKIWGCIRMTVIAISRDMGTNQRKAASLMDLGNIIHHPWNGGMASSAIGSDGIIMHICVAGNALLSGFGKFQWCMTLPAIHNLVLTHQGKLHVAVIEWKGFHVYFPPGGIMAIHAVNSKTFSMWGLLWKQTNRKYHWQN